MLDRLLYFSTMMADTAVVLHFCWKDINYFIKQWGGARVQLAPVLPVVPARFRHKNEFQCNGVIPHSLNDGRISFETRELSS